MRTDLDHLPAHKQRERDISPNYGKSAAKSIDGALQTWCNQAAADGCLVPEFLRNPGFWKANWGRMMAIWSPNSLRPESGLS
jgi:hypothetical protein